VRTVGAEQQEDAAVNDQKTNLHEHL
jgi:hypothetical protein